MSVRSLSARTRRQAASVAAVLALLGGVFVAVPAGASAAAGSTAVPASAGVGETAARTAAMRTGRAVEATALTTGTRQVLANPDGTFTSVLSAVPVRVRQGVGWRPVDTTLRANPNGTVTPTATSLDMVFSGGGDTPLVRLRRDGRELALRWPARLPAPVLSGDTATYREVMPGVDLTVRADVEGFSQLLVVKSAQAAANPLLAALRFATSTTGVSLRAAVDGSLAAVDPAGRTVFQAPSPYMWDSSGVAQPTAVPSGRIRSMAVRVDPSQLSVLPDRALLTAPDTRYPVYIDPSWSGATSAWTQVWSNILTTSFFNGANLGTSEKTARVGYDATDGKQTHSFFRFDTSGVKGRHILKATMQTNETWSRSCSARQIEAWETGAISAATTWKNQPAWISRQDYKSVAKGFSSSCSAGGVEFNLTAQVTKAAANAADTITEGLRASKTAEANKDTNSWKKFSNNPTVTIVYNTAPAGPTNLTTDGSAACVTGAGRLSIGTTTPILRTAVNDPDNAVQARFEWWTESGTAPAGSYLSPSVAGKTPTTVATTVPAGTFASGAVGRWRVRAEDGTDVSEWSQWCEFLVDTSRSPIPSITATAFPDNGSNSAAMGAAIPVVFGANGGATVTSYEYTVNGDATALNSTATPSAPGGSVSVSIVPDRYVNWIHVRSVNNAGSRSDVATVVFYATAASAAVGDWKLDEGGDGTVAVDSSPNARNATLSGTATWSDGRYGEALHLDGTSGYAATTASVVDTLKSFSVSAWVRTTDVSHNTVAVTQVGSHASAFALYYSSGANRWIFNRTTVDSDTTTFVRAISTTVPAVGLWTHLLGVYDAPAQQIRLYVNGSLEATTAFTTPWSATGGFQIGRSKVKSVLGEYWTGDLDAVQVYDRPLLPGEIQQVSRPEGQWMLDETSGTVAADALGLHPATWSATGVTRTTGIVGNAVQFSGGTLSTSGQVLHTDGSYTVLAWLRPGTVAKNEVALSQDGIQVSGFNLGYSLDDQTGGYRWSVRVPDSDLPTAPVRSAVDPFDTPMSGVWTHVVAAYDAQERKLRLYVNGQVVAETHQASALNATGALRLGSGRLPNTSAVDAWSGAIDDVRVYSGVLTDQEIYGLYGAVVNPEPTN